MITPADIYVWIMDNKWWLWMAIPFVGVILVVRANR